MNLARSFGALFLLLTSTISQALELGDAAAVGIDPERLERVSRVIENDIARDKIKGGVALVARDGQIVYHKAFGYADAESEKAMTTDSIFRIASMTKTITTIGVLILYENGHFQLNDPISKFLPEFSSMQVITETDDSGTILATAPAGSSITIIDLLTHTSGIAYPFIPSVVQKLYVDAGIIDGLTVSNQTLASQMQMLAKQPLLFEPGSSFEYGLNSDLAGYLIEVVSGQPLDEFFREHITGPLEMDDTWFYLPEESAGRLATLYADVPEKGLVVSKGDEADIKLDDPNFPIKGARSYFSGGAGLSSTTHDFARLMQMLLNRGELDGVRILSRKSVELMSAPRVDSDGDGVADLALGLSVVSDLGNYAELGSVGAYNWGGAFNTTFWIDPAERLIAVFMSQVRPRDTDIGQRFKTAVYQSLE